MVRYTGLPLFSSLDSTSRWRPYSDVEPSWVRPVHPNAIERRGDAARSRVRAATVGSAVNFFLRFAANNHSVFTSNRARGAPPAATAIKVACSTVSLLWLL